MADTIAQELHIDNNDVLRVLNRYWREKIAHVWQVDDMLECARKSGKPITRQDAVDLLHNVFDHHDSSLDVALEDYRLALKSLTEDRYSEVHGIFKVWRKGHLIAHQFGTFPHKMDDNLPDALEFAKTMAKEIPDIPVFVGCESCLSYDTELWLTITLLREETEPIIEEGEVFGLLDFNLTTSTNNSGPNSKE